MREPTAHKLQELVKLHAPPDASGYCFLRTTSDNEVLRYPSSGAWKLSPFHVPFGVPNGVYSVHFFRQIEDRNPLAPKNPLNPFPQVPFFAPTGEEGPATAPAASSPAPAETAGSALAARPASTLDEIKRLRAELHAELERQPAMRDTRVEYLQRQLALELQEQNQDLLKYGHYVAEVGGQFQLNRAYRMESQQAMETVLGLAKRTAEDAQTLMSVFRGMQELQIDALSAIKKQVAVLASPPPPPPPPDYTGTATAAVNLIRDISVALIQLKSPSGARAPEPSATGRGEVHSAEIQDKPAAVSAALPATAAASPVPSAAPTSTPATVATAETSSSPAVPIASEAATPWPMDAPTMGVVPAGPAPTAPGPASESSSPPSSVLTTPSALSGSVEPKAQATEAAPAEASPDSGGALAEKLLSTVIECQRLDENVEAGKGGDAVLPEVRAPKVEPPRSPLVDAPPPALSTAPPEAQTRSTAATVRHAPGAGWLDVLRFMFAGQKSALEQGISALRGRRKP